MFVLQPLFFSTLLAELEALHAHEAPCKLLVADVVNVQPIGLNPLGQHLRRAVFDDLAAVVSAE